MAQHKWFVKTYKTLGINAAQLYALWFLFFTAASLLYGYLYFLLYPVTKTILTLSPLLFFLWATATNHQKEIFKNAGFFGIVLFVQSGFIVIALEKSFFSAKILSAIQPYDFYVLPGLFGLGWLLNASISYRALKRSADEEWWLDIKLEGVVPSEHDIQVGHKNIDDFLLIFGEPRAWWEDRIQEPQARSFLARLRSQGDIFAMTASQIAHCADVHKEQAERWREALNDNPPSAQDWKNSGFDFSIPAQDKATAASHPGAPIAIPSLFDEKDHGQ